MPRGDKSSYSAKQKRQAEHIEDSEVEQGRSRESAERIAWATVNKQDGGAKGTAASKKAGKKVAEKATKPVTKKTTSKAGKTAAKQGARKVTKQAAKKTPQKAAKKKSA